MGYDRYTVMQSFKAYILLRCKTIPVGSSHWLRPPMPQFRITYTNMLVSKNAKPKICVTPNANPQRESVEYRFVLGTQRKCGFQWNVGFSCSIASENATK